MEKDLKTLLYKHGVKLTKAYGQNFLTDTLLLQEIVQKAGITANSTVLEIGPGAGALTREIAKVAKKVVAYEIDTRLKPILNETTGEFNNVEIIFKDVMKEKISVLEDKLGEDYVMVANLPYYITTPIVMNFLENAKHIKSLVIMVQKEVADRFSAKPNTSDYGAITVGINLRGSANTIIQVPREKFTPPPNVDSAVVKIDIEENKVADIDLVKVREVVKMAFMNRRKMLVNNVMNFYKKTRQQAEEILNACQIDLTARGEALSYEDFIRLSRAL
jgi:16S rRNA (adenine1518-N6/adenine1519-N6)-dimethyltransferase